MFPNLTHLPKNKAIKTISKTIIRVKASIFEQRSVN